MSATRGSRKRAVRLKLEAIRLLDAAIADLWRASNRPGKLTKEARAELLGMSVPTAERLLAGKGVDRTTIQHAFNTLGLILSDEYLEGEATHLPPSEPSAFVQIQYVRADTVEKPVSKTQRIWVRTAFACALILSCVGAWRLHVAALMEEKWAWHKLYYVALDKGTELFQSGQYRDARLSIDRAVALARMHGSAAHLASAVRISGDLALAQGSLSQAKECYQVALYLRKAMFQDVCRPPLLEALGDVETKMRDYHEARQNLTMSLTGFKRFNDRVGVAMAARDLGSLSFEIHDYGSATQWFRKGLASIDGLSKPDLKFDILGRQALVLGQEGRFKEAKAQLQDCLFYWRKKGHPRWVAESELQIGIVEAGEHHLQAALAHFGHSKATFVSLGDIRGASLSDKWLNQLRAASLD